MNGRSTLLKTFGGLLGVLCIFSFGLMIGSTRNPQSAPPPKIDTAPIDDSWVIKRMEAADKICGPVPFTLSATKDWFAIDCGRPINVGKQRVPRPSPPPITIPTPLPTIEKQEAPHDRHDG